MLCRFSVTAVRLLAPLLSVLLGLGFPIAAWAADSGAVQPTFGFIQVGQGAGMLAAGNDSRFPAVPGGQPGGAALLASDGSLSTQTVKALGATVALSEAARAGRVLTLEEFDQTGGADYSPAGIAACAAAMSPANAQGARIALLAKSYPMAEGWTIPAGCSVDGPGFLSNGVNWNTSGITPMIVLGRGSGVTVSVQGHLHHVAVARQGVNLTPPHIQDALANLANYTGTGLTIGQAADVEDTITLGNAQGYQVENANEFHARILRSDDLASLSIDNMHDVSTIRDFEAFPFITAADGSQFTTNTITGIASNGTGNLRVTTGTAHGLAVGNPVTIWGVQGMVGANGRWNIIAAPDATHFDISASSAPTTTATLSTSSQNVTVASTVGLAYGQSVTGPGVPANTTVWNVQPDTNTIQLSNTPTAAGSGVTLTFGQPAYTSGGTVGLYAWERPGACLQITSSEAPTFDNGFCFGHTIGVHLSNGSGWANVGNFQAEGGDGFNPTSVGLLIDGQAYASKIHLGGGDFSSFWSPLQVNTTNGFEEPTLVEGGGLYSQRQPNYGPSSIRIVSGNVILSNITSVQGDIFVGSAGRLQLNDSDATAFFGFGNQGYGSVLANITTSGTLFSDTPMATVRGGQGVGLMVPNPANPAAWLAALSVSSTGAVTVAQQPAAGDASSAVADTAFVQAASKLGATVPGFGGLQFALAPGSLGNPTGTMTNYATGDAITLACQGVSFVTPPIVGVTQAAGGAVTSGTLYSTGITTGPVPSGAVNCSQASTSGNGAGYAVTASLGLVASTLSLSTLGTGGGASNSNMILGSRGNLTGYPTTGPENTFLGAGAGEGMVFNSGYNTAVGVSACGASGEVIAASSLSASSGNTCLGDDAGRNINSPNGSDTLIGTGAGRNDAGGWNTFVGAGAGGSGGANTPGLITGYNLTALGAGAGAALTTGVGNTFLGDQAGSQITTGNGNVIISGNGGGGDNCANGNEFNVVAFCGGAGRVLTVTGASNPASSTTTIAGSLAANGPVKLPLYTIGAGASQLPACTAANQNSMAAVSDASAPAYNGALTGGGTVNIPVFCAKTGTNSYAWTAH